MVGIVRSSLVVAFLAAIVTAGCKSSSTPTILSGKVTYNGGPVTGGIIRFGAVDGESNAIYQGYIQENGTYTVTDVPQGEMICWIDTEAINPNPVGRPKGLVFSPGGGKDRVQQDENAVVEQMKKMGRAPDDAGQKIGKYMTIPGKYGEKKSSPLKTTTKGGKQTYNPELSD